MTRRPGMRGGYLALAAAAALTATISVPGTVVAQSNPTSDRVWAQCQLTADAVADLITSMKTSQGGNQLVDGTELQVGFVVIHSFQENNGQERSAGGFTGPVICRAPGVGLNEVEQTALIGSNSNRVDLLDQQGGMSVLYRDPTGSTNPADNKKRFCWTVASAADCFDFE